MRSKQTKRKAAGPEVAASEDQFEEHFSAVLGQLYVLEVLADAKATGDTAHAEREFWFGVTAMLRDVLTKIEAMNECHTTVSNQLADVA